MQFIKMISKDKYSILEILKKISLFFNKNNIY